MEESDIVFNEILRKLQGIPFQVHEHEAVRTSEQAAQIRGTSLASGAKAMLLRGNTMMLAVMAANRKLDWKKAKRLVGSKSLRFATEEQVFQTTGCLPGAVPPFGSIFGVQTYVDPSLQEQGESINFNAGMRTRSLAMGYADYFSRENPILGEFTKE